MPASANGSQFELSPPYFTVQSNIDVSVPIQLTESMLVGISDVVKPSLPAIAPRVLMIDYELNKSHTIRRISLLFTYH